LKSTPRETPYSLPTNEKRDGAPKLTPSRWGGGMRGGTATGAGAYPSRSALAPLAERFTAEAFLLALPLAAATSASCAARRSFSVP
jgi:hypothetical protein